MYFDQATVDKLSESHGIPAVSAQRPILNLDSPAFLAAALRKKKLHSRLVAILGYGSSPALSAAVFLRQRLPRIDVRDLHTGVIGLEAVGKQFTEIWETKAGTGPLLASRQSADAAAAGELVSITVRP